MKVYTFTVELPSGRVIVLEGEAPEDLDAADRSFLAALEGRTFSARGVPAAASWRRADRARVHLEEENAEPGRTPPDSDRPKGPELMAAILKPYL